MIPSYQSRAITPISFENTSSLSGKSSVKFEYGKCIVDLADLELNSPTDFRGLTKQLKDRGINCIDLNNFPCNLTKKQRPAWKSVLKKLANNSLTICLFPKNNGELDKATHCCVTHVLQKRDKIYTNSISPKFLKRTFELKEQREPKKQATLTRDLSQIEAPKGPKGNETLWLILKAAEQERKPDSST